MNTASQCSAPGAGRPACAVAGLIPEALQRLQPAPKRTRYKAVLRGPNYRPQRYVVRIKKGAA